MTKKPKIICIIGNCGVGKDYLCNYIIKSFESIKFKRFAFADRIKDIYSYIFSISLDDIEIKKRLDNDETRNNIIKLSGGIKKYIDKDIWINIVIKEMNECVDNYIPIITDMRYINEYNKMKDMFDIIVIKRVRNLVFEDENEIKLIPVDYTLFGDIENHFNSNLYNTCDPLLAFISDFIYKK